MHLGHLLLHVLLKELVLAEILLHGLLFGLSLVAGALARLQLLVEVVRLACHGELLGKVGALLLRFQVFLVLELLESLPVLDHALWSSLDTHTHELLVYKRLLNMFM